MSFTYDPSTNVGKVRMVLPDKVEDDAFFSDEELEALIEVEGNWRRATALALETIASDSAMVLQVVKVQNITTDGAAVAKALLSRASLLRKQADDADSNEDSGFDIIEMLPNNFSYREKVLSDALKRE